LRFSGPPLVQTVDINDPLRIALDTDPSGIALQSVERSFTWAELELSSLALAREYQQMGLRSGDRIASLMPNSVQLLIHYLAGLRLGLVCTPLNYRYRIPEIIHALDVSDASCIIYHVERKNDIVTSLKKHGRGLGHIKRIAMDDEEYQLLDERNDDGKGKFSKKTWMTREGLTEISLQQNASHLGRTHTHLDPDQPCFIYFTSGSTGKPKGVTHTRKSFAWLLASVSEMTGLRAGEQIMPGSSLSHIASSALALASLCHAASVVVPVSLSCSCLETVLRRFSPQVMLALPVTLFALVRDQRLRQHDFDSVRLCISGGDKVNHQLHTEFERITGQRIDEGYGMSEIGFASLSPIHGENRMGSVGKLCPGFEGIIRSPDGQELDVGEEGELWVRSPTMTCGYWGNSNATNETIQQGWLNTGDAMRFDEDGYLWFCGRRKQIIVHDGSNICPQDVEEALMEHPSVEQAGVIGIEDDVHGQNVHAYVCLKHELAVPTVPELINFARERVGYKAPEVIQILPSLPINSVGKIDRVALYSLQ